MQDHTKAVDDLRRALFAVQLPLTDAARRTLRAQVYAFVDELKVEGWLPERVIISVKRVALDAGFQTSARVLYGDGSLTSRIDALMVELVGWCIERYYGPRDTTPQQQAPI